MSDTNADHARYVELLKGELGGQGGDAGELRGVMQRLGKTRDDLAKDLATIGGGGSVAAPAPKPRIGVGSGLSEGVRAFGDSLVMPQPASVLDMSGAMSRRFGTPRQDGGGGGGGGGKAA